MKGCIIQISWFVDFAELSRVFIAVGVGIGIFGLVGLSNVPRIAGAVGTGLITFGVSQPAGSRFVIIPLIIVRFVEGASALVIYQKVRYLFVNKSSPSTHLGISKRVFYTLIIYGIMLILIWVLIALISVGYISVSLSEAARLLWTLIIVFTTIAGIFTKFWGYIPEINILNLDDSDPIGQDSSEKLIFIGAVFIISGCEIYNFQRLSTEILVLGSSTTTYAFGYYYSLYNLLSEQ